MLYWKFVLSYIVVSKSITVKRLKWVMMIQYCCTGMCPLRYRCMPYVYCSSKLSLCYWCLIVWTGYCHSRYIYQFMLEWVIWSDPKSYNRYYVHFCVPWILEMDSNDLHAGTTNDCICCLYQFSIHVDTHSICKSWFLWGLVGCLALPSHL